MKSILSVLAKPTVSYLILMLAVPPALAETIRCESGDNRYQYCTIKTHGDVRLVRQLSQTTCEQNRNWGYDSRGIWVDRGCRAEFEVSRKQSEKGDSGAAIAAGALAAILIGAAVASSSNKDKAVHQQEEPPGWLIGRFEGYDPRYRDNVELNISPSGAVTGYAPSGVVHGWYTPIQFT